MIHERLLTKVAELALPLVGDQQVGRCQVSVNHTMLMGVLQCCCCLQGQVEAQPPATQQLVSWPRLQKHTSSLYASRSNRPEKRATTNEIQSRLLDTGSASFEPHFDPHYEPH